jgi:purine-binding chemotaxis protein CheW
MNQNQEIFCFKIDDKRYGFPLASIERFIQAITINPVPNSPPLIYGLINYYGSLIPVINFRHCLKLPEKPVHADNYFIIVVTPKRKLAIVVDDMDDMIIPSEKDVIKAASLDPHLADMGFLYREDGIVFIYNIETFLSAREEELLQEIMDNTSE